MAPKRALKVLNHLSFWTISYRFSFLDDVSKLVALGFKTEDCLKALEICEGKLDDAALWLTQNAVPIRLTVTQENKDESNVFIKAVEVSLLSLFYFLNVVFF